MEEKISMVTGANAGIGYMTAKGLAEQGYQVVMVCRNEKKGLKAQDEIRKSSGNPKVYLLVCDLASQTAIRTCAAQFREQYGRLDLLVNNAGAFWDTFTKSPDGIEMQFAVNHLGYFLLTLLLLDLLRDNAPSRIVNVSSAGHYKGEIDFESFTQIPKGRYSGFAAYGQSKLANVLFTYELTRRLKGSNIVVNCLHPGVVRTNIGNKKVGRFMRFMWSLMKPFMITATKGAATSLYLATSPDVANITGKFFTDSKMKRSSDLSYDIDLAKKLWEVSAELTGLAGTVAALAKNEVASRRNQ
ncbi:MAG TPA: SDR family oxidoreductase [Bacteroidetes bacterium]|nr:SDR family oxidoreductase [Bacteroidota bacterium]